MFKPVVMWMLLVFGALEMLAMQFPSGLQPPCCQRTGAHVHGGRRRPSTLAERVVPLVVGAEASLILGSICPYLGIINRRLRMISNLLISSTGSALR